MARYFIDRSPWYSDNIRMVSQIPTKSGKVYEATVAVKKGTVHQEDLPDDYEGFKGQQRLFSREQEDPSEIDSAFSHSNMASRATIPVMLAHIYKQLHSEGHTFPMQAPHSLSKHSAPLAQHAVNAGLLIAPDNSDFDENTYEPVIKATNTISWLDKSFEWDKNDPSTYSKTLLRSGHREVPPERMLEAKNTLRQMMGRRAKPPKRQVAPPSPYTQQQLDV